MVVQTRKRKAAEEQEAKEAAEAASLASASKRQKKVPIRSKAGDKPKAAGSAKSTLITFDDDGLANGEIAKAAPVEETKPTPKTLEEPDPVDSDEDEAPEAVSTVKAASDVKKASQAAQKASREKAAAEKQKRRERDTLLKKQADERRQAEEESNAAVAAARPPHTNDDKPTATSRPAIQHFPQGSRKRSGKIPIPDLLPAEYLTDSNSEDEEAAAPRAVLAAQSLPPVRNVFVAERRIARLDRGAQDQRIGSTMFRVFKESDTRLAPKSNGSSRNAKHALLKRNRTAVKPGAGFFRKKAR